MATPIHYIHGITAAHYSPGKNNFHGRMIPFSPQSFKNNIRGISGGYKPEKISGFPCSHCPFDFYKQLETFENRQVCGWILYFPVNIPDEKADQSTSGEK